MPRSTDKQFLLSVFDEILPALKARRLTQAMVSQMHLINGIGSSLYLGAVSLLSPAQPFSDDITQVVKAMEELRDRVRQDRYLADRKVWRHLRQERYGTMQRFLNMDENWFVQVVRYAVSLNVCHTNGLYSWYKVHRYAWTIPLFATSPRR